MISILIFIISHQILAVNGVIVSINPNVFKITPFGRIGIKNLSVPSNIGPLKMFGKSALIPPLKRVLSAPLTVKAMGHGEGNGHGQEDLSSILGDGEWGKERTTKFSRIVGLLRNILDSSPQEGYNYFARSLMDFDVKLVAHILLAKMRANNKSEPGEKVDTLSLWKKATKLGFALKAMRFLEHYEREVNQAKSYDRDVIEGMREELNKSKSDLKMLRTVLREMVNEAFRGLLHFERAHMNRRQKIHISKGIGTPTISGAVVKLKEAIEAEKFREFIQPYSDEAGEDIFPDIEKRLRAASDLLTTTGRIFSAEGDKSIFYGV